MFVKIIRYMEKSYFLLANILIKDPISVVMLTEQVSEVKDKFYLYMPNGRGTQSPLQRSQVLAEN